MPPESASAPLAPARAAPLAAGVASPATGATTRPAVDRTSRGAIPRGALLLLMALTVALPVGGWLANIGGVSRLFESDAPPGQTSYLLGRLCALLALALGTWQCVLGATLRGGGALAGRIAPLHAIAGVTTFALFWAHVLLLGAAFGARKEVPVLSVLLPSVHDHYHRVQALGWLALVLLTAAVLVRASRSRALQAWHRLVYIGLPLALVHGIAIGTDARDPSLALFYTLLIALWIAALARTARRTGVGRVHDA